VPYVRRFTAILMLALLGAFYAVPLLHAATSDPESDLPACCRRHGKHHCAMMDRYLRLKASGKPAFSAPPEHCPFYPQGLPQNWTPFVAAGLPLQQGVYAARQNHPAGQARTQGRYCVSFDRARFKRGPPASLSA
jgi:hypothetical protein